MKEVLSMNAYKMHEVRMWLIQVIIPATMATGYVLLCTDIPEKIKKKREQRKLNKQNKKASK